MSSKIEWLCLIDMACPVDRDVGASNRKKSEAFRSLRTRNQSSLNITSGLEGTLCQTQEWNSDNIVAGESALARRVGAIPLFLFVLIIHSVFEVPLLHVQ